MLESDTVNLDLGLERGLGRAGMGEGDRAGPGWARGPGRARVGEGDRAGLGWARTQSPQKGRTVRLLAGGPGSAGALRARREWGVKVTTSPARVAGREVGTGASSAG